MVKLLPHSKPQCRQQKINKKRVTKFQSQLMNHKQKEIQQILNRNQRLPNSILKKKKPNHQKNKPYKPNKQLQKMMKKNIMMKRTMAKKCRTSRRFLINKLLQPRVMLLKKLQSNHLQNSSSVRVLLWPRLPDKEKVRSIKSRTLDLRQQVDNGHPL